MVKTRHRSSLNRDTRALPTRLSLPQTITTGASGSDLPLTAQPSGLASLDHDVAQHHRLDHGNRREEDEKDRSGQGNGGDQEDQNVTSRERLESA